MKTILGAILFLLFVASSFAFLPTPFNIVGTYSPGQTVTIQLESGNQLFEKEFVVNAEGYYAGVISLPSQEDVSVLVRNSAGDIIFENEDVNPWNMHIWYFENGNVRDESIPVEKPIVDSYFVDVTALARETDPSKPSQETNALRDQYAFDISEPPEELLQEQDPTFIIKGSAEHVSGYSDKTPYLFIVLLLFLLLLVNTYIKDRATPSELFEDRSN
ncbi:MAG: hypothetical protein H6502_00990 [Candidatus Woesearchaeota archaeon]|nr:MAG: hypothetical protein H6502_00990 [Candidatus Woesearchaeota archaeon]